MSIKKLSQWLYKLGYAKAYRKGMKDAAKESTPIFMCHIDANETYKSEVAIVVNFFDEPVTVVFYREKKE